MSALILDAGNSIIKAKIARKEQGEITFPHAIRQLTETEYVNILTEGGSALLYKRLLPILNHSKVILADEIEYLDLANVRGGLKLWRLYEALKLL